LEKALAQKTINIEEMYLRDASRTPTCDRRTDGQTDGKYRAKNRLSSDFSEFGTSFQSKVPLF